MKITTKYGFGDKVKVLPLDGAVGKIVGIHMMPGITEYKTRYFQNGESKLDYFEVDELRPAQSSPTGFRHKNK